MVEKPENKGHFIITDEPELYRYVYGEYPPNYSVNSSKGMFFTDWLASKGMYHKWDAQTQTASFYLGKGRVITWKPGQPIPIPGLIIREGRFIVDDENKLLEFIYGNSRPGSPASGGASPNGQMRFTDWLDFRGFPWNWNDNTKVATFIIEGISHVWVGGDPSPFPGVELFLDDHFYVTDEVALRNAIYNPNGDLPAGRVRFTDWLDAHGFKWNYNWDTHEASFELNGATYKWKAGTSTSIPGIEPMDGHFYITDEKALNKFVFGFEVPPQQNNPAEIELVNWLARNGYGSTWTENGDTFEFKLNGKTITWKKGQPEPIPGTEFRPDNKFYVIDEEAVIRFLGEDLNEREDAENRVMLRPWLRARNHSYVWDDVNKTARFYIHDICYTWQPGQRYPIPGIKLDLRFGTFYVIDEDKLRSWVDNAMPPKNQPPDVPPYERLTNWMNKKGLRYEWISQHERAIFYMPYQRYLWYPGDAEPFEGVTLISGYFYVTDEPKLEVVMMTKPEIK